MDHKMICLDLLASELNTTSFQVNALRKFESLRISNQTCKIACCRSMMIYSNSGPLAKIREI